jgi:two-component system chemotaxis response regulator CheY
MPANLSMKVLVVDDFATMRRIVANVLRQIGFENIVEAEDGPRALKVLGSEAVDFVITDWNMPEMSGLDLLKAIRAQPDNSDLPVLVMTNDSAPDSHAAAVQAGANGHIVKPFDARTLTDKVNKIFP